MHQNRAHLILPCIPQVDAAMTFLVERESCILQVWCLDPLPDRTGFVSCSADKHVKVWKWDTADESSSELSITEDVSINTGQDVLCVKISPDSKLIACSLVSNVIKVCGSALVERVLSSAIM